jgi:hypothetical protein
MRRFKIHYAGQLFDNAESGWDVIDTHTGSKVSHHHHSDAARHASDVAEALASCPESVEADFESCRYRKMNGGEGW